MNNRSKSDMLLEFSELSNRISHLGSILSGSNVSSEDLMSFTDEVNLCINKLNSLKLDIFDFYRGI